MLWIPDNRLDAPELFVPNKKPIAPLFFDKSFLGFAESSNLRLESFLPLQPRRPMWDLAQHANEGYLQPDFVGDSAINDGEYRQANFELSHLNGQSGFHIVARLRAVEPSARTDLFFIRTADEASRWVWQYRPDLAANRLRVVAFDGAFATVDYTLPAIDWGEWNTFVFSVTQTSFATLNRVEGQQLVNIASGSHTGMTQTSGLNQLRFDPDVEVQFVAVFNQYAVPSGNIMPTALNVIKPFALNPYRYTYSSPGPSRFMLVPGVAGGPTTVEAAASFDVDFADAATAQGSASGVCSLPVTLSDASDTTAVAGAVVEAGARLDDEASTAVVATAAITETTNVADTATGEVDAAGEVEGFVVFGVELDGQASAEAQAVAEIAVALNLAANAVGSTSIDAAVVFDSQFATSATSEISIEAAAVVDSQVSAGVVAEAQAAAAIVLDVNLATMVVAEALTQAGVTFASISNVVVTGSVVTADFVTPDRRTFSVRAETRVFTVVAESRDTEA